MRCLAACLCATLVTPVSAAVFDFSYVTRADDPFNRPVVAASGKITASLFGGNDYSVTGITGKRAGVMIDGFDDFDTIQTFTLSGTGAPSAADFAYRIAGLSYNVFGMSPIFTENPTDPDTLLQAEPARTLASLSITPAAVPEPASWLLMIGGLGLVGVSARWRRGRLLPT